MHVRMCLIIEDFLYIAVVHSRKMLVDPSFGTRIGFILSENRLKNESKHYNKKWF